MSQAPPRQSRRTARRGQLTHRRKALIRERIDVAKALWANVAAYSEVWMRFHNRIGGFTDVDVDRILTDTNVPGANVYTSAQNEHHFLLLRAFPHSEEPLKCDPARWARIHASKMLDSGLGSTRIPVPAVDQVMNEYLDDIHELRAPAAAATSSSSSSSSESESDLEWVVRRRAAAAGVHVRDADMPARMAEVARERERQRVLSMSPPLRRREPAILRAPAAAAASALDSAPNYDPMDAEEGWDEDLQRAISESIRDVAPTQPPRYVPRVADQLAVGVAPAVVTHAPSTGPKCAICFEVRESFYRVSFMCGHFYCATCIVDMFVANPNALNRCPGCALNRAAHDLFRDSAEVRHRYHFLTEAAVGIIDPHFLRILPDVPGMPKISELIRSGVQLDPFFPPHGGMYWTNIATKCPHCRQRIIGSPSPNNPSIRRCTNAICGAVFCGTCNRDWSDHHFCPADRAEDLTSAAAISSTSKPCPKCRAPVTHYRDHGCHRIRCGNPSCTQRFCYICRAEVRADVDDPDDEALETQTCRCPPFCKADGSCGCQPCPDCRPNHPCQMARDNY
jgi:hypothetical protein